MIKFSSSSSLDCVVSLHVPKVRVMVPSGMNMTSELSSNFHKTRKCNRFKTLWFDVLNVASACVYEILQFHCLENRGGTTCNKGNSICWKVICVNRIKHSNISL